MRFVMASEIPGRLRLRLFAGGMADSEARGIEACLREVSGVGSAEVHTANETLLVRCAPPPASWCLRPYATSTCCVCPRRSFLRTGRTFRWLSSRTALPWRRGAWSYGACSGACCFRFRSQMLPDDKARYVEACVAAGHGVIMVGDGINDSPALAAASVSVALADASDIARSVADVSVRDDVLERLVYARVLAQRLQQRISSRYRLIVGVQLPAHRAGNGGRPAPHDGGDVAQPVDGGNRGGKHTPPDQAIASRRGRRPGCRMGPIIWHRSFAQAFRKNS